MAATTRPAVDPLAAAAVPQLPWDSDHPLARLALRSPRDFELFQLLHVLERTLSRSAPIGKQGPARLEPIRIRPMLDLTFPPADIDTIEWRDGGGSIPDRLLITTTFLGLYGANSPLPTHFTEALMAEDDDDVRVRDFLDLFHHRVHSLLYRVWVKYRYYVTFRYDGSDAISHALRGMLGLGTAALDDAVGVDPVRLFRYVGLLSQQPRSAAGLEGMLRDFFAGIDISVQPCVGRWLRIERNDQNRMGLGKCTLGSDMLLGERVFDRSGKFRIRAGPVGLDEFQRLLPDGEHSRALAELTRFYCIDPIDFDVEVTLRGDEVPETPLTPSGCIGRLGWTTWMKSRPCADKPVVFRAHQRTAPVA